MEIKLIRTALQPTYTIGKLYINGTYFCDTLEDAVRDTNHNGKFDNGEKKINGETAIPYGGYEITLSIQSPRFKNKEQYSFCKGYLPRLLNVPSFEGVLIHIGNTAKDSSGCILVGENKIKGSVINSTATFKRLYSVLAAAANKGEKLFILIT